MTGVIMSQSQPITEDDIAHFLVSTPSFFERQAALLASVQLTSPHSHRAISLQERQAELLRRKINDLERGLADLLRASRDNAGIAQRLQVWTAGLLRARSAQELPALVESGLKTHFDLPQVTLRLWDLAPGREFAQTQDVGASGRAWAAALERPYCGPSQGQEALAWLDEPEAAASVALLALRPAAGQPVFGLLVLASQDPQRFQASMATDFLHQIGEIAGAALSRLLPDNSPHEDHPTQARQGQVPAATPPLGI